MTIRAKRRLGWLTVATALVMLTCVGRPERGERRAGPVIAQAREADRGRGVARGTIPPVARPPRGTDRTGPAPLRSPRERGRSAVEAEDTTVRPSGPAAPVLPGTLPEQPLLGQGQLTEAIVRLRLEQAVDQIILGLARDTTIFLPMGQFTDLAEVFVSDVEQGQYFRGRIGRRPREFEINTRLGIVRLGDEVTPLDSTRFIWRNDDLFIDVGVIAELFDVRAQMDWTDLELRVWDAEDLPAVQRYERNLRRRLFEETGVIEGAERLPTLTPPIDGAVLDWSVTSLTTEPFTASVVQVGAGAQVIGGSLDLQFSRIARANINNLDWSWIRAWSGPAVRQVQFGEIAATGRANNAITGASITNAPYRRPVAFADEILAGEFPEGWEVEVYRGNRLVAFSVVDSTGRFGISLPVQYGPNPVTLVGYGPRGEVVVRERTFEIPFLRLPGGTFEYGASVGECISVHCQATTNADLRYGVSDRLTVQAGTDFFWRDTVPDRLHPYALASMALTRSFSVTGETVWNASNQVRADFAPTPDFRLSLTQTWFDQDDPTPLVGSVFERQRTLLRGFWRPGMLGERLFFEARGRRSRGLTRNQDFASVSSTLRWSGARLTTGLFVDRTTDVAIATNRAGLETSFNTVLRGPVPILKSAFLTADARIDDQYGVSRFGVGLGRQLWQPLRIDIRTEWDRVQGTRINLELTSIFRQVRAVSRNQFSNGTVYGSQSVEGSLLWNRPGKRAEFSNGRAMGRAGLTGQVFLDENTNGVRDPGEPGIGAVRLRVGSTIVTADSLGRFAAWDLVPFEPALVEIDPMSIDNPLWVPRYGPAYITPTPNSYQLLDLPVLQGGEVNGQVVFAADGRPLVGGSVLLIHEETGDTTRVTTFSDGTFYAFGLRPGIYSADLSGGVLIRLNGVVAPVRFEIHPNEGVLFADDVTLVVVREDERER